jgi:hypothetical protein
MNSAHKNWAHFWKQKGISKMKNLKENIFWKDSTNFQH